MESDRSTQGEGGDAPSSHATALSPFDVGTDAQLFVDRVLVHDSSQVAFTLHPAEKHPDNPVVQVDRPWEGWRLSAYGNVLFDEEEGVFKMWYMGHSPEYFEFPQVTKGGVSGGWRKDPQGRTPHITMYAVSQDGVNWEKPLVGTIPALKGERFGHNAVAQVMNASVIKDSADPDPGRRYKMICWVVAPQSIGGTTPLSRPTDSHGPSTAWSLSRRQGTLSPATMTRDAVSMWRSPSTNGGTI